MKRIFFGKVFFVFRFLSETFPVFWREILGRVVKTAACLFRGTF